MPGRLRPPLLSRVALVVWGLAVLVVGATLTAPHLTALPAPPRVDPTLAGALDRLAPRGRPLAVHFLGAECGCSRDVLRSLRGRAPVPGVVEHVVLVDGDAADERALRRAGYVFEALDADRLVARYGVEAVPLLVVRDGGAVVRYAAGYTRRKRDRDVRAPALIADAIAGRTPDPLPTFGCAVSRQLRAQLDPLGLR